MRALVSGGSSGIGAATCVRLAEAALARGEQPQIAVCGHKLTTTQEQAVRSIQSLGGTAIALVGDLSDPDVPGQLVDAAVAEFGGLDGLVANAGIANPGALCDLSVEDWDHMFSVNLRGAWLLAKASYPHLARSRGSACFTSSMSGQQPHAGHGAYSPSKAALTMLAQTLALEWARDGIRVNVVSPGMTHTPLTAKMYADPQIKKAREGIIPLSRIGDPTDIANVIEFLVGPLSGYVTGQDICVDGGFSKSILSHIPGRPSSKALNSICSEQISTNLLINGLVIVGGAPQRCALAGSGEYAHLGRAVRWSLPPAYRRGVVVRGRSRSRDHRDEAWLEALVQVGIAGLDALVATSVVGSARPSALTGRSLERPGRADQWSAASRGVPAVAGLTKPSVSGGLHA